MPSEVAIYEPPRDGLPYLVVTFASGSPKVTTATSREQARVIASEKESSGGENGAANHRGKRCCRQRVLHKEGPSGGQSWMGPAAGAPAAPIMLRGAI
jgi:hypothetical protein